jgi:hypothetical protein
MIDAPSYEENRNNQEEITLTESNSEDIRNYINSLI